jgi:hypothetical protein
VEDDILASISIFDVKLGSFVHMTLVSSTRGFIHRAQVTCSCKLPYIWSEYFSGGHCVHHNWRNRNVGGQPVIYIGTVIHRGSMPKIYAWESKQWTWEMRDLHKELGFIVLEILLLQRSNIRVVSGAFWGCRNCWNIRPCELIVSSTMMPWWSEARVLLLVGWKYALPRSGE